MTTIAELVRFHRRARALTQEELAARAHLTAKAVGAIERGERRRPYPQTVRALADALGLDAEQRAEIFAAAHAHDASPEVPLGAPRLEVGGLADVVRTTGPVVGRTEDITTVRALLRGSTRRLITLTGPGGVGKSTVARLAAEEAAPDFPDGVVMVPLADIIDPAKVVGAAAAAVGVPSVGFDTGVADLAEVLLGRSMLLVLDTLEHLLSCGPDLADLVTRCPDLRLLATSRRPLRIRAEQRLQIAPLSEDDALVLFHERLAAVDDGVPEDVARALCGRTDGLPLAVELAASAASYLGPEALAHHFEQTAVLAPRDLPPRQRTMALTFDWSWALLGAPARTLLSRLSVCSCFTLGLAEAVVDEDAGSTRVALVELLEHSLVVPSVDVAGVRRFRLLDPIRQNAARRLGPADRDDARRRLARHTLALARELVYPLRGSKQAVALQVLDAEFANVRESMLWLTENSVDDAAELLCRVWLHLALRRHIEEGRGWAERLDERPMSDLARARLLLASAGISMFTAPAQARDWARESLTLSLQLDNERLSEEAAALAASAAIIADDLVVARDLAVDARRNYRTADPWVDVMILISAGHLATLGGRLDEAEQVLADAEVTARGMGAPFEIGSVLTARASVLDLLQRPAEGATCLVEALDLCVAIENSWTMAYTLSALGSIAVRVGDDRAAARFFGASAGAAAKHFVRDRFPTTSEMVERDLRSARQALGGEVFESERRGGRGLRVADLVALARAVRERAARQRSAHAATGAVLHVLDATA